MTPVTPLTNYITQMAAQSGISAMLARDNPFFPGNPSRVLSSLCTYDEDAGAYGGFSASSEVVYHNFEPKISQVLDFERKLREVSAHIEGGHAPRVEQELSAFHRLIAGAQAANSRIPRGSIDTSKTALPDLNQEIESFENLRRFLAGHVSLARLALEGADPARIYFDLDPAEIAIALGLSALPT